MRKETLLEKLKSKLASLGFKMFLWGSSFKEEEYWEIIYQQEKQFKSTNGLSL